jgi:hypothetical protein
MKHLKFDNYFFEIKSYIKILGNYKYGSLERDYKDVQNLNKKFSINIINKNISYKSFQRYYYSFFIKPNSNKIIEERKLSYLNLNFAVVNLFGKNIKIYTNNIYNYFSYLRFSKKKTLSDFLNDITFINLLKRSILTFHGAAFSVKKKSFIVTAPPDTGKSETIMNILKLTKSKFISEDLLLVQNKKAISLPYTQTLQKRKLSFLDKLFSNIHKFLFKSNFLKKTIFDLNDFKKIKVEKNNLKIDTIFYLSKSKNKNESLSKVIINKKKIIDELIKINHLEFSYFKNELILAFISSHSNQKDISHWINYEKKMTIELLNKSNVVEIICGKNKKFSDEIYNFLREKKVLV